MYLLSSQTVHQTNFDRFSLTSNVKQNSLVSPCQNGKNQKEQTVRSNYIEDLTFKQLQIKRKSPGIYTRVATDSLVTLLLMYFCLEWIWKMGQISNKHSGLETPTWSRFILNRQKEPGTDCCIFHAVMEHQKLEKIYSDHLLLQLGHTPYGACAMIYYAIQRIYG